MVAFLDERNPAAARRAWGTIDEAIRSLDTLGERGRRGPSPDARELAVRFGQGGYVIRYILRPAEVIITRIFHSRERR